MEKSELVPSAIAELRAVQTLLDIGPGIKPQTLLDSRIHICAEPFGQYADRLVQEHPDYIVLNCTWAEVVRIIPPASVDTVVLLDVIEHLEKEEGLRLLAASVELARCQVVVFTPLGFLPQGEDERKDAWGLDGVDWQVHRSGWLPEDFPGWDTIVCEQFYFEDGYGRLHESPYGAFFAILNKGVGRNPGVMVQLRRWERTHDKGIARSAVDAFRKSGVVVASLLRRFVSRG